MDGLDGQYQYSYQHLVYAASPKDVPKIHRWLVPQDYKTLPKRQLKVRMCCAKCEEKVLEEIWEASGVFDVKTWRTQSKVVVTAMPTPIGLNECQVLRKARKIDCNARFVKLDDPCTNIGTNGSIITDPKPPVCPKPPQPPPEKCRCSLECPHRRPWPPYCPPWPEPWPQYCGPSWPSPSNPEPPALYRRQPLPADRIAPFYFYLLILLVLMLLIFSKFSS